VAAALVNNFFIPRKFHCHLGRLVYLGLWLDGAGACVY
jgi:hypothetical protein